MLAIAPRSGYVWCVKNHHVKVIRCKLRYFSNPTRGIRTQVIQSNIIPFIKRQLMINSNHYLKGLPRSFPANQLMRSVNLRAKRLRSWCFLKLATLLTSRVFQQGKSALSFLFLFVANEIQLMKANVQSVVVSFVQSERNSLYKQT